MRLRLERRHSPIGEMLLVSDADGALRALDFADYESRMYRLLAAQYGPVTLEPGDAPVTVANALDAYFVGELSALEGIAVRTAGTAFQRAVWAALRTIPAGVTESYGGLAARIGRPKASRAVGAANGANPVALIVPCHRVIGTSGALTGYGGGIDRKRWLLEHERARTPRLSLLN